MNMGGWIWEWRWVTKQLARDKYAYSEHQPGEGDTTILFYKLKVSSQRGRTGKHSQLL